MDRGARIDHSAEQFDNEARGPGLASFLKVVLVLLVVIVVLMLGMAYFGTSDGMLPFDYEGF